MRLQASPSGRGHQVSTDSGPPHARRTRSLSRGTLSDQDAASGSVWLSSTSPIIPSAPTPTGTVGLLPLRRLGCSLDVPSHQPPEAVQDQTTGQLPSSPIHLSTREREEREPGRKHVRFSPTALFLHTISHTIIPDTPLASLADHAQAGPVGRPASVNHFTKYEMHEKNEIDESPHVDPLPKQPLPSPRAPVLRYSSLVLAT
jgi:hypothetical protein